MSDTRRGATTTNLYLSDPRRTAPEAEDGSAPSGAAARLAPERERRGLQWQ